jgi:hypothetical protein
MNTQSDSAASARRLESAAPKQRIEAHAGVPKCIRLSVLTLEQRGLGRQDEPGVSALVEPDSNLFREVPAERYHANAPLAGTDPEVGTLEVDIDQTQPQRLAKSQAGAK